MSVVFELDLTTEERASLEALVQAGQWGAAYQAILNKISDPSGSAPASGMPIAEWLGITVTVH